MKKLLLVLPLLLLGAFACQKEGNVITRTYAKQPVGVSANHILSDAKFDQLIIEIQYMTGQEPTQGAVNALVSFIEGLVRKPAGVSVVKNVIPAQGKAEYSISEIASIEDENRTQYNDGSTLSVYFLFVDGDYEGSNGTTLGVAYRNTSMCIFHPNITDNTGGVLQPSQQLLETTVLEHEFGHIMGLVDLGSEMQTEHLDEAHGKHCDVQSCLMYYTVETTDVISNLGNNPPALDAQCRADLTANGGK